MELLRRLLGGGLDVSDRDREDLDLDLEGDRALRFFIEPRRAPRGDEIPFFEVDAETFWNCASCPVTTGLLLLNMLLAGEFGVVCAC